MRLTYFLPLLTSILLLTPLPARAQYIEMRTDFDCGSYTVFFDFFAENATPSWKQVRVFIDERLDFSLDLDGDKDVIGYYSDSGTLPSESHYRAYLYKQRSNGWSNAIDREDLRLASRRNTCPTPEVTAVPTVPETVSPSVTPTVTPRPTVPETKEEEDTPATGIPKAPLRYAWELTGIAALVYLRRRPI